MNTFYHVDTTGRLKTGMTIELASGQPSIFGQNYLAKFKAAGVTTQLESGAPPPVPALMNTPTYREYFLELFRRHNPRIKELTTVSRLSSFFAVKNIEDAKRYMDRHNSRNQPIVYSVHCEDEHPSLDMTWLDQEFPRDIKAFMYYYEQYWKGHRISQDEHLSSHEKRGSFMEVLITSAVTIGDKINIQEF